MRIISNFHDFYDTAMGYGQDLELIYLRKPKVIKGRVGASSGSSSSGWWHSQVNRKLRWETIGVGFCGKVYGCVKLMIGGDGHLPKKSAFCYDLDRIDKFIEENFKKKFVESYYQKSKKRWIWRDPNYIGATHAEFKGYFDNRKKKEDEQTEFFLKHKTPIFVSRTGNHLTLNASLKKVEFYRVFDPYTAFQELQMYWGGLAAPHKPIPEISDADMLIAKGFDPRFSFRKDPGGKKRKKKKKDKK